MDDILQSVGPAASLIFAAWIFLSFLQQRYVAAFQQYRSLVDGFRQHEGNPVRRDALEAQVRSYRRRCDLMRWSTNVGAVAAICFLVGLLAGLADSLKPLHDSLTAIGAGAIALGFLLVIIAAVITLIENTMSAPSLDDEVRDLEALQRH
jgi:ferric-dicitrate binding protein FerR (iron transport regulator)